MTDAVDRARDALAMMDRIGGDGWCLCVTNGAQEQVAAALRDLLAEHDRGDEPSAEREHTPVPWSPTGRVDSPATCTVCGRYLYIEGGAWAHHPETEGAAATAARTVGDYEALDRAIGGVLFNVSNFPERAQSRLLGQNMRPLTEKLVDAVQAAGFQRVSVHADRSAT